MYRNKKTWSTQRRKKINRWCLWGSPDIGFTRQKLQIQYFKCVQRTKENHDLRTKTNYENNVSLNKEKLWKRSELKFWRWNGHEHFTEGLNRFEQDRRKKIIKLEDKSTEMIKSEEEKGKNNEIKWTEPQTHVTPWNIISSTGFPEKKGVKGQKE